MNKHLEVKVNLFLYINKHNVMKSEGGVDE
jgi:hypothetical protein